LKQSAVSTQQLAKLQLAKRQFSNWQKTERKLLAAGSYLLARPKSKSRLLKAARSGEARNPTTDFMN